MCDAATRLKNEFMFHQSTVFDCVELAGFDKARGLLGEDGTRSADFPRKAKEQSDQADNAWPIVDTDPLLFCECN